MRVKQELTDRSGRLIERIADQPCFRTPGKPQDALEYTLAIVLPLSHLLLCEMSSATPSGVSVSPFAVATNANLHCAFALATSSKQRIRSSYHDKELDQLCSS